MRDVGTRSRDRRFKQTKTYLAVAGTATPYSRATVMTKRILLCDDEIHILRAAEFKLKKAGYDVRIASDGQEGWEAIQQQKPDILITDCQMPRLDGLGLVKKVRENSETATLPIFMLTAKGFELSHDDLAAKWDVMAVIAKPFSPRELLQRVDGVLGGPDTAKPQAVCSLPTDACPLTTVP
jgi:two-component system, OmpR family, alkaline phosphatase synthesis response regulator PhoP